MFGTKKVKRITNESESGSHYVFNLNIDAIEIFIKIETILFRWVSGFNYKSTVMTVVSHQAK